MIRRFVLFILVNLPYSFERFFFSVYRWLRGRKEAMDEVDLVFRYISAAIPTKVMIDVGAHTGGACRAFIRTGWTVFAFEPDSVNRSLLLANLGKTDRLIVETYAVNDKGGERLAFFTSDVSSGISGLSAFHASHRSSYTVDTITLKDYMASKGVNEVGFLKVDTEGFDLFVLKGFPWETVRPSVIVCEFENRKTETLGYTYDDLAAFLVERNYSVLVFEWHPIVEYGQQHRFRRFYKYPGALAEAGSWGNLIAFDQPGLMQKFLDAAMHDSILDGKSHGI